MAKRSSIKSKEIDPVRELRKFRDVTLEEFKTRLVNASMSRYPEGMTVDQYFELSKEMQESWFLKARFYSEILSGPNTALKGFKGYRGREVEILRAIEVEYREAFAWWFNNEMERIERKDKQLIVLNHDLRNWHKRYLGKRLVKGRLKSDVAKEIQQYIKSNEEIAVLKHYLEEDERKEQVSPSVVTDTPMIEWIGQVNETVHLFDILHKHRLISDASYNRHIDLIMAHFVRGDGKCFKKRSLEESRRGFQQHSANGPRKSEGWAAEIESLAKRS